MTYLDYIISIIIVVWIFFGIALLLFSVFYFLFMCIKKTYMLIHNNKSNIKIFNKLIRYFSKKVYCADCIYIDNTNYLYETCNNPKTFEYKSTPISYKYIKHMCITINENNNCKYYKKNNNIKKIEEGTNESNTK